MLEPDCLQTHRKDPSLRSHTFAELGSWRFHKSSRFVVGRAHATKAMWIAAPKVLACLETADVGWDCHSDHWPQHCLMGMEVA
jgi:hypothetical protein